MKDIPPRLLIDPSTTVGLEIRDSSGVTLDGLVLDATTNEQTLVMVQFARSRAKVRRTALTGTVTGNTFKGFLNESHVLFNNNGYAGVKLGKNTIVP